jgi:hypothetical protein
MADTRLRWPFLVWAVALIAAAWIIEGASGTLAGWLAPVTGYVAPATGSPPGRGVPALVLIDGLLLLTVGLMASPLLVPGTIQAKAQGIITLVVAVLAILGAIATAFAALAKMFVMIALLLAFPFGTIVYFIRFADFDRGGAAAVLAVVWTLKLTAAVLLVLAHQRCVAMKGLVLLLATSLAAGFIVGFLHAFLPGFLASITDCIAAIVVAIIAIIWGLILAIGAIPAVVKAVRLDR